MRRADPQSTRSRPAADLGSTAGRSGSTRGRPGIDAGSTPDGPDRPPVDSDRSVANPERFGVDQASTRSQFRLVPVGRRLIRVDEGSTQVRTGIGTGSAAGRFGRTGSRGRPGLDPLSMLAPPGRPPANPDRPGIGPGLTRGRPAVDTRSTGSTVDPDRPGVDPDLIWGSLRADRTSTVGRPGFTPCRPDRWTRTRPTVNPLLIPGRPPVDPTSTKGRPTVDPGSTDRPRIVPARPAVGQGTTRVRSGSARCRSRIEAGWTLGRPGVDPGSTRGRSGVDPQAHSIRNRPGLDPDGSVSIRIRPGIETLSAAHLGPRVDPRSTQDRSGIDRRSSGSNRPGSTAGRPSQGLTTDRQDRPAVEPGSTLAGGRPDPRSTPGRPGVDTFGSRSTESTGGPPWVDPGSTAGQAQVPGVDHGPSAGGPDRNRID